MLKKALVLGVIAVSLTGCIIAPLDDGYDRGGRGGYDHRSDRGDHRYDQRRSDRDDRRGWNWNGR